MFADKNQLKLDDDQHEGTLVELNSAEVDDVSGGLLLIAAAFALGYYYGYAAGRRSAQR